MITILKKKKKFFFFFDFFFFVFSYIIGNEIKFLLIFLLSIVKTLFIILIAFTSINRKTIV